MPGSFSSSIVLSLPYLDPNMPSLEEVDIEGVEEDQVLVLVESAEDFSLPCTDVKDLCNTPASEYMLTSGVRKSLCHVTLKFSPYLHVPF